MVPLIKVCGLTNLEDAFIAKSAGVSIIGVILSDLSPRKGTPELVRKLSANGFKVAGVYTDLETAKQSSSFEDYIQLHFQHGKSEIDLVHNELGKRAISVVFPQKNEEFLKESHEKLSNGSDLVLIDYGREITEEDLDALPNFSEKKIGLAGKISIENIDQILKVNPFFIDLSSKLEEYPGKKDHRKIEQFMEVFRLAISPV